MAKLGPAVQMGVGLVLTGAAGFAFIALTGHVLSASDHAAVAQLYVLVNLVGQGVFIGLEQETSRATSSALARGGELSAVIRTAVRHTVVLLAVTLTVLVVLSPVLVGGPLGDHWILFPAVLLGVVAAAAVFLVRGLLGGTQQFSGYAVTLGVEGLFRLVPCAVIMLSGMAEALPYALIYAVAQLFATAFGLRWLRTPPGKPLQDNDKPQGDKGMLMLVGASLLTQLVANLPPLVVGARLPWDPALIAAFTSAFILARTPQLLFAPVQAMMLPALTAAAARGEWLFVRRRVGQILGVVLAIGLLGVIGFAMLGPWVLGVFFSVQSLSPLVLALLATGTIFMMALYVLQPALIAFDRHRTVTVAWAVGAVLLTGLLALPGDPVTAAVIATLVGPCAVFGVMAVGLGGALSRAAAAQMTEESVG